MNQAQPDQRIIWQPQPGPQTALIACPVFEVFFGGARGGGKTEGSLGDWLQHSAEYNSHAIGIFVRRNLKQLSEVIARARLLFEPIGAKYNETKAQFTMPGGARLKFVYLERDADAENYQGHSYTRVYIEEATNFPSPDPIYKLFATLRSAVGVPCGVRLTGNPGGPGHMWVKSRYIDPNPAGYEVLTETMEFKVGNETLVQNIERVFIPSKISDNMLMLKNDPGYLMRLAKSGSEALVKAWLDGDWNSIEGAFFDEWDSGKHVLPIEWLEKIPKSALKFRAFDWGSAAPFSVGWYVVSDGTWGLPKNALLKYREWYGAIPKGNSGVWIGIKMNVDLVAKGILEREKGEVIKYGVADPAIFLRDGGPSKAENMNIAGVSWQRGDNRRQSGSEMMHIRLQGYDGEPMLYFLETCEASIRTIPMLQHSDINSEDLDTKAEDHSYDETRYAIMSRPWLPRANIDDGIRYPKHPSEMSINELIKSRREARLAQES